MPRPTTLHVTYAGLAILIGSLLPTAFGESQVEPGVQVLRVNVANRAQLDKLVALDRQRRDLEVWADRLTPGPIDVRVSGEAAQALREAGLSFEVAIPDLKAHYDTLFDGRGGDFFDTYRTYQEHVAFMQDLQAAYPSLVQVFSLGQSILGREMWTMRITGPGDDKVGVMYHGGQHGNEIMGTAVVAYTARRLLEGYGQDAEITELVDNVEWFLLPIMNPDGYIAGDRTNAGGADLNRDWGGPGTGDGAFSEPETVALAAFFVSHPNVIAHMDFHTSGRMIMWPWGYTPELCDHHDVFGSVAASMAERIYEVRGVDYWRRGPIYTTIYPVVGGSVDYTYGILGRWGYTIEIGYSHYMPPAEIVPTGQEMAGALEALTAWTYDCNANGVSDWQELALGQAADCNGNLTPDECELIPDFDGDGIIDLCDDDIDNDGVPNEEDACPYTPAGVPIQANGRPIGDTDGNCSIDAQDYARFRNCWWHSGPGTPASSWQCEEYFDFDGDTDVDLFDASKLLTGFSIADTG